VHVPPLQADLVQHALLSGLERAQALREAGLIWSAALVCQHQMVSTDTVSMKGMEVRRLYRQAGLVFA